MPVRQQTRGIRKAEYGKNDLDAESRAGGLRNAWRMGFDTSLTGQRTVWKCGETRVESAERQPVFLWTATSLPHFDFGDSVVVINAPKAMDEKQTKLGRSLAVYGTCARLSVVSERLANIQSAFKCQHSSIKNQETIQSVGRDADEPSADVESDG